MSPKSHSPKISKDKFFDQEVMKNARAGAQYWYEEIWQNVGKCVFCDLNEKYIIHEKDGIVLTTNIFPYIDGQVMIIPRKHVNSLKELTQNEWETIRMYGYIGKKIFRKVHKLKDMWFLLREGGPTAQKTVTDHLHVQLIPFDKPDLAKWNYRKLKYTPLENAQKYQKVFNYIEEKMSGFQEKYSKKSNNTIIGVDAVIMNEKGKILLGRKKEGMGETQYDWHLPGGRVETEHETLEEGLIRELKEETSLKFKKSDFKLLHSKLEDVHYKKIRGTYTEKFLFCTYLIKLDKTPKVKAGDDIAKLEWKDPSEVKKLKPYLKDLLKIINGSKNS